MQNPYFELLTELAEICEKNKIQYYLTGKILYFISNPEEPMPDNFSEMEILMDGANAKKLIQACHSLPKDRVLETPLRNPKFRNLDMFYIHTKTTSVNFSLLDRREFLGINIPIRIIRPDFSKVRRKIYRKLDILWQVNCGYHFASAELSEKEEHLWKLLENFHGNGDRLTRLIFKMYLKTSLDNASKKVFIYTKRSIKPVPVHLLKNKTQADIEGHTFPVMERYHKYMSILFWKKLEEKALEMPRMIVDAEYFDREFETALFKNDDFWNRKLQCKKTYTNYKFKGNAYESDWEMTGCIYRGITAENRLAQQKNRLQHMLELKNYTGILSKMKSYKDVLDMHKKYNVPLDHELFEIYSQAETEVSQT